MYITLPPETRLPTVTPVTVTFSGTLRDASTSFQPASLSQSETLTIALKVVPFLLLISAGRQMLAEMPAGLGRATSVMS